MGQQKLLTMGGWGVVAGIILKLQFPHIFDYLSNELQWYPRQPQRLGFTNLSDACCETTRWKHLLNLTWLYTKASQTISRTNN
jgi:hypothetical protein